MLTANYWRNSYHVTATRLTPLNIKEMADIVEGTYVGEPELIDEDRYIFLEGYFAHVGDWVVIHGENREFWEHEEFLKEFHTLSELSFEEKTDQIHKIVMEAVHTSVFGISEQSDNVETIAMDAVKKILDL
jgi:hypothetical protein